MLPQLDIEMAGLIKDMGNILSKDMGNTIQGHR
jgi:hypothetical protein